MDGSVCALMDEFVSRWIEIKPCFQIKNQFAKSLFQIFKTICSDTNVSCQYSGIGDIGSDLSE